jgi:hypothetical protein
MAARRRSVQQSAERHREARRTSGREVCRQRARVAEDLHVPNLLSVFDDCFSVLCGVLNF